jgi:hypothetical protein
MSGIIADDAAWGKHVIELGIRNGVHHPGGRAENGQWMEIPDSEFRIIYSSS